MTPSIPDPLLADIERIKNQIVLMFLHWKTFKDLFGASAERVELLNESAPNFFSHIERALLHSMTTGIGRLLDPARMGSNENDSLKSLVDATRKDVDSDIADRLQAQLAFAMKRAAPILGYRNKKVAHSDRAVALGHKELGKLSREAFDETLQAIADFMNILHVLSPTKITVAYEYSSETGGSVDPLLSLLRDAAILRALIEEDEELRELVRQKKQELMK